MRCPVRVSAMEKHQPLGAAVGLYTGALAGAVSGGAGSGGDLNSILIGAAQALLVEE